MSASVTRDFEFALGAVWDDAEADELWDTVEHSSSRGPTRDVSCVACMNPIEGPVVHARCGHDWDARCAIDLCRSMTRDESLYPPSCCPGQLISFRALRQHMDRELTHLFNMKVWEFSTPHRDRVYCSLASCPRFLGPASNSATTMSCDACGTQTCGHCKKEAHAVNQRCTNDADEEILSMATREGWKQCPGCSMVVELTSGCNHMTCRCGHQFCYVCLARWRTCACPQWEDLRLMAAEHDPELLAEAIRNEDDEDLEWPPRPRPLDHRGAYDGHGTNVAARPMPAIPRQRAADVQVRPAAPVIPGLAPAGWRGYGGPIPVYLPPNQFAIFPLVASPYTTVPACFQHSWLQAAPWVDAAGILRGCTICGNVQVPLWGCARCLICHCVRCI